MDSESHAFKRSAKILLYVIATLSFLIAALVIIAVLPPGENIIKGILAGKLSDFLGQDVSIEDFETNLLTRIQVTGLEISGDSSRSEGRVLRLNDIKIHYSLSRILAKKLIIESVQADSIGIYLRRDSVSGFNLAILDSMQNKGKDSLESADESGFQLELGDVSVAYFQFYYDDRVIPAEGGINNLSFNLKRVSQDEYRFDFKIDSIISDFQGLAAGIRNIQMNGRYTESGLGIDTVLADAENLNLRGSARIGLDSLKVIGGSLSVSGNTEKLLGNVRSAYDLPEFSIKGDVDLGIEVSGSLDTPGVTAHLDIPKVVRDGAEFSNISLVSSLTGDSLSIDSLAFESFEGTVAGGGYTIIDSTLKTQLDFAIRNISLPVIWTAIYKEESPYKGVINGTVSIGGHGADYENWSAEAAIDIAGASYNNQPLPGFYANLIFKNSRTSLKVHQEAFDISSNIVINDNRIKGDFKADINRLEPLTGFLNQPGLSGRVSAEGEISGTIESPSVGADIRAESLRYANFPVDSLAVRIDYGDSTLFIERMNFSGGYDSVTAGKAPFGIDSIRGGFHYSGELSGTLSDLLGEIVIRFDRPGYGSYGADSALFNISLADGEAKLENSRIFRDDLIIEPSGRYGINKATGNMGMKLVSLEATQPDSTEIIIQSEKDLVGAGRVSVNFDLSDSANYKLSGVGDNINIGVISRSLPDTPEFGGIFNFDLDFSGTPDNPAGVFSGSIRDIQYSEMAFDSCMLKIKLAGETLDVSGFKLYGVGQELMMQSLVLLKRDTAGEYLFNDMVKIRGEMKMDEIDLGVFGAFLPEGMELAGQSSLDLEWDGSLYSPNIKGWLTIDSGQFVMGPEGRPIEKIEIKTSIQDSLVTIGRATADLLGNPLRVEGSLMVSEFKRIRADLDFNFSNYGKMHGDGFVSADSIDFEAQIEKFDLEAVQPILTYIKAINGVVNGDLNVSGPVTGPDIKGNLDVHDLKFHHTMLDSTFHDGVIKASFNDNKIHIDSIYVRSGGGSLLLTGDLEHKKGEITDVNLKVEADSLRFSQAKVFSLDIRSMNLSYARKNDFYLLEGDIEPGETRLTKNFRPQSILPWAKSVEQTETELPPILAQTRLDVRIRESDRLWVDNNLARIRMRSALGIIGNPVNLNFSGRVTIEEGYFLYLDRKFQVKKGNIYFSDPNRFNPEVDIAAETKVTTYQAMESTEYTIKFSATGMLDDMQISLTSEPELDKTDIVAVLTFGATRNQLTGKEEGGKNALVERAKMFSSDKISGYVSRKIGTVFGLDQVSVQGNLFDFNDSEGPQVTAAKQISERTRVTYTTTVGHLNEQSIRIDYRLTKHISLEGQTDREANSSIGLKYGIKFK